MPAIEESKIEGDGVKKKKTNDYAKDETKFVAEEGERNSTEEEAEPVVIAVVDHN